MEMEDDTLARARDLLENTGVGNMENRNAERIVPLMNALITGYSIALTKTLGSGAGAMTQLLLTEVGDVLSAMIDEIMGDKQSDYELQNVEELIRNALRELGVAEDITVDKSEEKGMIKYRVLLRDSIFSAVHRILINNRLTEFPLSPEGLLLASVVRRVLRERTGGDKKARVNVITKLPVKESEPLVVEIKQVSSLN